MGLLAPQEFSKFRADYLFCQEVLQVFPGEQYTVDWLENVDRSGIQSVMLQPRYSKTPQFKNAPNSSLGGRGAEATMFDSDFILKHLKSYKLVWQTDVLDSGYVFYI